MKPNLVVVTIFVAPIQELWLAVNRAVAICVHATATSATYVFLLRFLIEMARHPRPQRLTHDTRTTHGGVPTELMHH